VAADRPLSRIDSALQRITRDLDGLRIRWALVGGLAVSARVEPRFTRDIDLVVAVEGDDHAERLIRDLQGFGYRVAAIVEQEATGRLAASRLIPPHESESGVVVDALFASSGIEAEVAADADMLDILPGIRVPVASIGHLIALKVLSRDDQTRPQDRVDLLALINAAEPRDIDHARAALALIESRGFHRRRDLSAQLTELLRGRACG
jgi:predicted nucleotidyltransferase